MFRRFENFQAKGDELSPYDNLVSKDGVRWRDAFAQLKQKNPRLIIDTETGRVQFAAVFKNKGVYCTADTWPPRAGVSIIEIHQSEIPENFPESPSAAHFWYWKDEKLEFLPQ